MKNPEIQQSAPAAEKKSTGPSKWNRLRDKFGGGKRWEKEYMQVNDMTQEEFDQEAAQIIQKAEQLSNQKMGTIQEGLDIIRDLDDEWKQVADIGENAAAEEIKQLEEKIKANMAEAEAVPDGFADFFEEEDEEIEDLTEHAESIDDYDDLDDLTDEVMEETMSDEDMRQREQEARELLGDDYDDLTADMTKAEMEEAIKQASELMKDEEPQEADEQDEPAPPLVPAKAEIQKEILTPKERELARELAQDTEFNKIFEDISLQILKTDSRYSEKFLQDFSGDISDKGYLMNRYGNETSLLPSEIIGDNFDEINKKAIEEYAKQYPEKWSALQETETVKQSSEGQENYEKFDGVKGMLQALDAINKSLYLLNREIDNADYQSTLQNHFQDLSDYEHSFRRKGISEPEHQFLEKKMKGTIEKMRRIFSNYPTKMESSKEYYWWVVEKIRDLKVKEPNKEQIIRPSHEQRLQQFNPEKLKNVDTNNSFAFDNEHFTPGEIYRLSDINGEQLDIEIIGYNPQSNELITSYPNSTDLVSWNTDIFKKLSNDNNWAVERVSISPSSHEAANDDKAIADAA